MGLDKLTYFLFNKKEKLWVRNLLVSGDLQIDFFFGRIILCFLHFLLHKLKKKLFIHHRLSNCPKVWATDVQSEMLLRHHID